MEMNITKKIKYLSLFLVLIFSGYSSSNEVRNVNELIVDDYYERQINLGLLGPQDYWVLIVIDGNLDTSHEYLKQLQHQKTNMSSTIIVLLNSNTSKEQFHSKYHASLQPYSWVNAKASDVFKQINISATPVVFGMNKDTVMWQNSGVPNNFDEASMLSKQIESWIIQKVKK